MPHLDPKSLMLDLGDPVFSKRIFMESRSTLLWRHEELKWNPGPGLFCLNAWIVKVKWCWLVTENRLWRRVGGHTERMEGTSMCYHHTPDKKQLGREGIPLATRRESPSVWSWLREIQLILLGSCCIRKSWQLWNEHGLPTVDPTRKMRSKVWVPRWFSSLFFCVQSEIPCHRMTQPIFMGVIPLNYPSQEITSQIQSEWAPQVLGIIKAKQIDNPSE